MLKPPKTTFMNLQSLQLTTSDFQEQSQFGQVEQLRDNIQKSKEINIYSSDACVIQFEDYSENKYRKITPDMVYSMTCRKSLAREKQEREVKVRKYLEKKRRRNMKLESQPLYQKKRIAANKRLRIQGQFLSKDETMMMKNAYGNHVFDKKQNFNLEKEELKGCNQYGYQYVNKKQVMKAVIRFQKERQIVLTRLQKRIPIFKLI